LCCTRKNAASNVLEASQAFLLGPWERRLRESNIQHNERGTCRVLLVLFCTGPMQNFFFLFFLFVCLHLVLCTHQRNSLLLVSYVVFSFSGTHVPLGDFFFPSARDLQILVHAIASSNPNFHLLFSCHKFSKPWESFSIAS